MLTFPMTMFGGGGGITSVSHTDNSVITTDLTTYTFSTQAIGTAAADRVVVVGISASNASGARTVSSVTIGGITATAAVTYLEQTVGASRAGTGLYAVVVPTGTTADVVITFSGSELRCGLDVWAIYGASSATAVESDQDDNATTNQAVSLTLEAIGDAVICVGSFVGSGAVRTSTWSADVTENSDVTVESVHAQSGAQALVTVDITSVDVTASGAVIMGSLSVAVFR